MLRITKERKQRSWSKAQLPRRARLDQALVSKIESGRVRPYPREIRRLANALGVRDPAQLLEAADEHSGSQPS